jgi:MerR family transcriptional regulator, copper efflux regulator
MKAGNGTMTVGTAARRAGVKIDTIRYYERRALLPKSSRTEAGYRTFTEETVQRLRFIKHAQALGFTLNEIKQLLALRLTPGKTCADVRSHAEAKIADVERKIRSLHLMKRALQQLVSACKSDGPASECSFLQNLNKEDMLGKRCTQ